MKTAIALAALLFVVCAQADHIKEDYMKKIAPIMEACADKYGTTKEEAYKLYFEKKLPETQAMKCTYDCFFTSSGFLKDGKLDWDAMKAATDDKYTNKEFTDKALKVLDACQKIVNIDGKGECERSIEAVKCIFEESKRFNLEEYL